MFLTKISLSLSSKNVRADLFDPYRMHCTLSRAFGDEAHYRSARCLFRAEEMAFGAGIFVLVQTRVLPKWENLAPLRNSLLERHQVKEFELKFSPGEKYRFRLRANPTVKRDGRRVGLYVEEDQIGWLCRKGESCGFSINSVRIEESLRIKSRAVGDGEAVFSSATFEGGLTVTDADKLCSAVECGIGSGKGFGFGLLSLARVRCP